MCTREGLPGRSPIAPSQARLTLEFLVMGFRKRSCNLLVRVTLSILLSLGPGCHTTAASVAWQPSVRRGTSSGRRRLRQRQQGMTWLAADRGEGLNVVGSFGAVHGRLMAQATFLDPLAWRRC
jgi:hypothetical protein